MSTRKPTPTMLRKAWQAAHDAAPAPAWPEPDRPKGTWLYRCPYCGGYHTEYEPGPLPIHCKVKCDPVVFGHPRATGFWLVKATEPRPSESEVKAARSLSETLAAIIIRDQQERAKAKK